MTKDSDDPKQEAKEIHDRRAKESTDPAEKQKIKKEPVRPLLGEPGGKSEEWD